MQFRQDPMDMFGTWLEHFMQSPQGVQIIQDLMSRHPVPYSPPPMNDWPQQPPARPPGGPSPLPFNPGIPGGPPSRPPGGPGPWDASPKSPPPMNDWPQQPPSMPNPGRNPSPAQPPFMPSPERPSFPGQPPSMPNPGRNPMPGPYQSGDFRATFGSNPWTANMTR